jgi:hypothetical protein
MHEAVDVQPKLPVVAETRFAGPNYTSLKAIIKKKSSLAGRPNTTVQAASLSSSRPSSSSLPSTSSLLALAPLLRPCAAVLLVSGGFRRQIYCHQASLPSPPPVKLAILPRRLPHPPYVLRHLWPAPTTCRHRPSATTQEPSLHSREHHRRNPLTRS